MSSRILRPGEQSPASPVVWKKIGAAGGTDSAAVPVELQAAKAEWERQCERKVIEARAAGQREGEATGRSRAAAELQPIIDRLSRSIEDLAQWRPKLRREAESDMIRLSLAIARRILRRELVVDPDAMHGLVLGALDKLQSQEICRVRVHPSHAAVVSACLRQMANGSTVEVISDGSRELGGVVFETQRGNLDASVESQLQEIERGLADRLNRNQ
ncbi:MAG TPA: FliH/SctL family protein [Bryobacteraceae bacterium]|nr:FliH/SctL family protein [Bryobacteraceae bacterium]